MRHALILAGGVGTRLWPWSRKARAKQFLTLVGTASLLRQTYERMTATVPPKRILVITNAAQVDQVRAELPEVRPENVIGEPCGRNTAPCVALAACLFAATDPDAVLISTHADHVVAPVEEFTRSLQAAEAAAGENAICLFGIPPRYPATVFGYIHRGERVGASGGVSVFEVKEFREKPDRPTAEEYCKSGQYYWNSGAFACRAETMIAALAEHEPAILDRARRLADGFGRAEFPEQLAAEYPQFPDLAIDYAVMERYRRRRVVEATFEWDDVGSWLSLPAHHPQDAAGNTTLGEQHLIDTKNCILVSDREHLLATIGVEDLIVVHTPDATLVCHQDRYNELRRLVQELGASGKEKYL